MISMIKLKLKPDKSPHKVTWYVTIRTKIQLKPLKLPHKTITMIKKKLKLAKIRHK